MGTKQQPIETQINVEQTPEDKAITAVIAFNALVGVVRSDSPEFEKASIEMGNALSMIGPENQSYIFETARLIQEQEEA